MSLPSYYSIYDSFVLDTNGNIGIGTAYPKSVIDITNRTDAIIIPSKDAVTEETETPPQPSTKVGVLRMNKAYGRFEKKQGANWGQTSVWQPVITSANPTKLQNIGMQTTVNGMLFEIDSVWSFVGTDGTNYPCVSQFVSQFQVVLTRPNVFPASKSPYRIRVYNTEASKEYILSTLLIDAGFGPTFTTPAGSLSNLLPNTFYNPAIVISATDEVNGGISNISIDSALTGSGLTATFSNSSLIIGGTTVNAQSLLSFNFTSTALDFGGNAASRAYSFTIKSKDPIQIPEQALTSPTTSFTTTVLKGTFIESRSSQYNGDEAAWKVFDKNDNTIWTVEYIAHTYYKGANATYTGPKSTTIGGVAYTGEWVQLQFPSASVLTSYSLTAVGLNNGRNPKRWYLAGSSDGSTWSMLDTRSEIGWSSTRTQTFTLSAQSSPLSYFRLIVYQIHSSSGYSFLSLSGLSFNII